MAPAGLTPFEASVWRLFHVSHLNTAEIAARLRHERGRVISEAEVCRTLRCAADYFHFEGNNEKRNVP